MGVITERERAKYFAYLDGVADGLNESRDDVNSVLDKIRAEVEAINPWALMYAPTEDGDIRPQIVSNVKEHVLEIIDKNKAGSEL